MVIFTIIVWTLFGLVAGGMLGGALADLGAGHRGDIGALFVGLLIGALFGAGGGGALGLALTRKFAGQKRKLELLAAGSVIGIVLVVLGVIVFETGRESRAQQARLPKSLDCPIRNPPAAGDVGQPRAHDPRAADQRRRRASLSLSATASGRAGGWPHRDPQLLHVPQAAADRAVALRPAFQQPAYLFTLRLPERPQPGGQMTGWQRVDRVDEGGWFKGARPARPDEQLEIRYVVMKSL